MDSDAGGGKPTYLDAEDNLADLVSRIPQDEQQVYSAYRYIYTEAAFFNRRFVVIKTHGKDARGKPLQPTILGSVRVLSFRCDHEHGSLITLMQESSSKMLQVGHVPVRLFRFPAFVSVPIYQGVKWEAKENPDGSYARRLVFGICFKQQSNVKFYNKDNVAVVTPNEYRKHFGDTLPRL